MDTTNTTPELQQLSQTLDQMIADEKAAQERISALLDAAIARLNHVTESLNSITREISNL